MQKRIYHAHHREAPHRDWERVQQQDEWNRRHDEEMRANRLISIRQCLFASPHDQNAHRSALEYGKQYIDDGGNGPGHIRYEQLVDDYRRRMEENDWDYSPQNRSV